MEKYQELDRQLIKAISDACAKNDGTNEFTNLLNAVAAEARRIAGAEPARGPWGMKPDHWRIVDRRLQALRKAGKIFYGRGKNAGWRIAEGGAA